MIKYSLLSSQNQLHFIRTGCCRTDRNTVAFLLANKMFLTSLSHQTDHLTPDLNPVDYSILDPFQQLVYQEKIMDIDHLKQILNSCYDVISQELINDAIDQWSKQLMLVISFVS